MTLALVAPVLGVVLAGVLLGDVAGANVRGDRLGVAWFSFYNEPASSFKVRGHLGGHEVALRAPAS